MSSESVIEKAIEDAKQKAKPRNFVQTWDLVVILKNIDLSKAENRISLQVRMPHSLHQGKRSKICLITNAKPPESLKKSAAEGEHVKTINEATLKSMKKPELKQLANNFNWFLAEAPLMVTVGKILGPLLGPRGKQPRPFPPGADPTAIVKQTEGQIALKLKLPVVQIPVGKQDDETKAVRENIEAILEGLEKALPKGSHQLRSKLIKLTMGPAVRF